MEIDDVSRDGWGETGRNTRVKEVNVIKTLNVYAPIPPDECIYCVSQTYHKKGKKQ